MKQSAHLWFFWLAVAAALSMIVPTVIHLAPVAGYFFSLPEANAPGYTAGFPAAGTVGESAHFTLNAPPGYLSQPEIDQLLVRAERTRAKLVAYLEIPEDERRVTIRLYPGEGVPYSGTQDINLFAIKAGHTSVVHELTHYLMGYPNGLLAEGLAIVTEDRYGWGLSFPNMLRPVEAGLYSFLRKDAQLVPLNDLWLTGRIFQRADIQRSRLRYLQAASLACFLMDKYSKSAYLQVYRGGDFSAAFGKPLDQLDADWQGWVRRNHRWQAAAMTFGGLAVVGLFHLGLSGRRRWLIPACLGLLAFIIWDYNLYYPWLLPLILIAGIIAGGITARFNRVAGLALIWSVAGAALIWIVLLPADAFQLIIFLLLSVPILIYSWPHLRDCNRHGFYRFFLFESALGLIILNAPVWFRAPFSFPQVISWLLLLASIYLVAAAVILLHKVGQPEGSFEDTTQLVTSGIYRFIRHPMYASLLALGWGVFLKDISILSGALTAVLTAAVYLTARTEEAENLAKFGQIYRDYMLKTRRFIPFLF